MPVFHKTIDLLASQGYKDYKFVIPTVETTEAYIKKDVQNWSIKPILVPSNERYNVYANTFIAIAASGTVSAELAIMHIPAIVVYKMNPLTILLAHILLTVKWASLVNILMDKTIYPELLGGAVTPKSIVNLVKKLTLPNNRKAMINDLKAADNKWRKSHKNPAKLIADDILNSQ